MSFPIFHYTIALDIWFSDNFVNSSRILKEF